MSTVAFPSTYVLTASVLGIPLPEAPLLMLVSKELTSVNPANASELNLELSWVCMEEVTPSKCPISVELTPLTPSSMFSSAAEAVILKSLKFSTFELRAVVNPVTLLCAISSNLELAILPAR